MIERHQQRLRDSWLLREYTQVSKESKALLLDGKRMDLSDTAHEVDPPNKFLWTEHLDILQLYDHFV